VRRGRPGELTAGVDVLGYRKSRYDGGSSAPPYRQFQLTLR
jgi:hypothetical protein